LVLALLADADASIRDAQWQASNLASELRAATEALLSSRQACRDGIHLPLLDLANPTLALYGPKERAGLLAAAQAFVAADGHVGVREFALLALLERRLGAPSRGSRSLPSFDDARATLLAFVDWVANATAATPAPSVDYRRMASALDRIDQLAPLRKPAVVKQWMAAATNRHPRLSLATSDVLRAMCAAIDAPLPPLIEAHYMTLARRPIGASA
jgi:hypothetical protein